MKTKSNKHGLIFTGESVSRIMAGTKTMTRRVVKGCVEEPGECSEQAWMHSEMPKYPYGVVGDRLWVREAWRTEERAGDMVDGVLFPDGTFWPIEDSGAAAILWIDAHANGKYGDDWRSPMFMPRWASRLTLEIIGIRVERLQDITEEDAKAEGIIEPEPVHGKWCDPAKGREGHWSYRKPFADAWDKINSKRATWESNPFVWVISFKVVDRHPTPLIAKAA